ncbi:MAG: hypothetical protein N4A65_02620 [Cohaesibacter sp.]|jgi:hypothetical protein|nr:hypothetical protein [Cohaesibacter sp.]
MALSFRLAKAEHCSALLQLFSTHSSLAERIAQRDLYILIHSQSDTLLGAVLLREDQKHLFIEDLALVQASAARSINSELYTAESLTHHILGEVEVIAESREMSGIRAPLPSSASALLPSYQGRGFSQSAQSCAAHPFIQKDLIRTGLAAEMVHEHDRMLM